MNKSPPKSIWLQLVLLGIGALIGWIVISHYAFDWSWATSIGMGVFFSPFFFGFFGVAFFLPRMME